VFILATGVVLITLTVDLLYLWLDPRILLER
jgi:ABC-type dipeptide/oligopeptide/nickel transport system permease component